MMAVKIWVSLQSPKLEPFITEDGVDLEPEPSLDFCFDGFKDDTSISVANEYAAGLNELYSNLEFYVTEG